MNVSTVTMTSVSNDSFFRVGKIEGASSYKPLLMAVVFFFLVLSIKVSLGIQTTRLGYYSGHEMSRSLDLRMERQELELELSVLLKEEELFKNANRTLGLREVNPNQMIILR